MNHHPDTPLWLWAAFWGLFIIMLMVDLVYGVREDRPLSMKRSAAWTVAWIVAALLFNAVVYMVKGPVSGMEFLAGYLIEKALSVDNLFVFVLIFTFFGVPRESQPRVLKWGILGAIILRGIFIAAGAALLERFRWAIYVFGAFLIWTGIKMYVSQEEEVHPDRNIFVRLARRFLPLAKAYNGSRFTVEIDGRRLFTPLFVVLLVVESTDVIFAVDSIPAIFGISHDPFIVFSSNIFAVMGLRALYFLLVGALGMFRYLKAGVSLILVLVGLKMLIAGFFHVPVAYSLAAIFLILSVSVVASIIHNRRERNGSA